MYRRHSRGAAPAGADGRALVSGSQECLSPGQADEIDRVYRAYPHLNDDAFVAERLDSFLA